LSFNPLSPATTVAGSPDLNITATGSPAGGTYSSGSVVLGGTGGSFSAIHPSLGTFTFGGSSSAGTASSNITYTPVSGSPLTLTYSITVTFVPPPASLSFNPLSPASLTSGDPDLNITANGSPVGGTYTSSNASSGSTGGTFSSIHPSLGTFTYSGSTASGTASVDITYTPVVGAPVLQSYVVNVSATPPPATLSFNPLSPATFTTGSPALTVTATGSPSGGTYSSGSIILGGTGGSFSAVHPSLGTFTFGSASSAGTASIGITYTPLSGAPVVATYVVTVVVTPPPASLSFNPLSPASVTAGDPDLNITALGSPSGGTFSSGASLGGSTGGSFTAVHPSLGTFTYMGSTSAGTASIDITYTPLVGSPVTLTYSVDVSAVTPPTSLSFNPLSPSAVVSGSPALNITASGSPAGGSYTTSNALSGGTGGTFSSIHPSLGTFTFSGSSSAGSASVDVTYTPLSGSPLTLSYVVNVSVVPPPTSLSFNPLSPATTVAGSPDLNIIATGSPVGGTYSSGSIVLGGTGGSFSAIHPSLGTFTFGGSSSAGTASSNITYTPVSGSPLTLTYSITVTFVPPPASLSFNPLSPASLTSGDPDLNITANGSPVGGSYTSSNASSGSTGGSFSSIHPSLGTFTYGGSTASGTASVDITYTPVVGAPVLQSYVVNVSATPPPATLSFNPLSPATFATGSPALTVTAIGSPVGGTYSSGSIVLGGTGGSFSAVHPSLGTFTFGSASSAGTASIGITYTPLSGAPVVATYVVTVVVTPPPASLSFNPLSPASVTAGDPDLNITALGSPSGGTFTSGASLGGSTGGSFTAVHPSLGTFTYMGSTSAGTASIDITYTPLVGAPVVVTYSVDVSAVTPPATLNFNPLSPANVSVGAPVLNITASGSPSGGSFSNGASVGGGTGGSFSSIHPSLGTFTFSGATVAGTASITITYTPLAGAPAVTTYSVVVSAVPPPASLAFNPVSPASITAGDPTLNVTATGTPSGGSFTSSNANSGTTGGSFTAVHPSLGTFTFSGTSAGGSATVDITYTPLAGAPVLATYTVSVGAPPPVVALSFNPASPAVYVVGSPALSITATGTPSGGTYSTSNISTGGTNGSFGSIGTSSGVFTFSGATLAGVALIDVTYTPVSGSPLTLTYTVNVSAAPPPATLSFNPVSPASVTIGAPALNITATGTPSGGTFSSGASMGGGTGGSFSAIQSSLGTFTYSGSTSAGTAGITITYTPLVGAPAVVAYNVNVSAVPPPATLGFNPLSPAVVTVGDPVLNLLALGTPSGGTYSNGVSMDGTTGGSFTTIHPSLGTFTYSGSSAEGTATVDITYTPLVGAPAVMTYVVNVVSVPPLASLAFSPLSPAVLGVGSAPLNITATGSPVGGTYSSSGAVAGGTGGSFSAIHPSLGTFTYSGSTSAGTATVDITYTPLAGAPAVSTYSIIVTAVPPPATLAFNPLSPATISVGDPDLNITATGSPVGGTYSSSGAVAGGTGGSFSAIHPSLGTFVYSGSTSAGTASINITYTPLVGAPVVANYSVSVVFVPPPASLSFNPLSPASVTAGDPDLNITATGSPSGGTYSTGTSLGGGTGGTFSAVHPSLGTFVYSGSTSAGTATVDITYTPLVGAPVIQIYTVNVSSTPPPATLSFNPLSPASVTVGDPALNITATGTPSGGTFSNGASVGGGTGGSFSAVHPSLGTFNYSGSTGVGTASITITYTPLAGASAVATYNINVSSAPPPATLSFNPLSPASVTVGDPALNITATGTPSGGTFSNGSSMGGSTGGFFSAIHPSLGTFSYTGSTGAGTASITITYTPLAGAPAVATYEVDVSAVPPPATLSFSPLSPASVTVGAPALNITAAGTPSGGTFSNGASMGGGTGGSFSAIHPSLGTFNYTGSTSTGTASITITYTPLAGAPAVATYEVDVSTVPPPATLSFNPLSPASVTVGDPALNITATGTPSGGTFSNGASVGGGTGGSFSAIHPSLGTFNYSGSTGVGTASITITYTPLAGAPAVVTYEVDVSAVPPPATLSFNPLSPASVTVGDPALNITATGTPSGGTFSNGASVGGGTGGNFSAVHPSLGTFNYSGSTGVGTASITITYTPLAGAPAVATYEVDVSTVPPPATLSFNPLSPASVTVGDPALNITATGTPSGGTFSNGASIGGGTGGSFSAVHPSLGTFNYSGSTGVGTASITITYTPLAGAPAVSTYNVNVSSAPPPATLSFNPLSPASVTVGDPALNITATGTPSGGTFSNGASMGGGTGGSFSAVHPSLGTFNYTGSTGAGTASITITYTPLAGAPAMATYEVDVSAVPPPATLSFSPLSPASVTVGAPALNITATGTPSGGTFSNGASVGGGTGGSFSAIHPSLGSFSYTGSTSAGTASITITYTPLAGAPAVATYEVDVSTVPPPATLSFNPLSPASVTVGDPALNITATGTPSGGTFSNGASVGGGTGGSFSAIHPSLGTFNYSGSTGVGTASITITYTPLAGAPAVVTYEVDVSAVPPPATLSFNPLSPASVTVGDPALNITATGTPSGGTFSNGASVGGGTGGNFSAVHPSLGTFNYSGSTGVGTASITITYTPLAGAPAVATYEVDVSTVPPPATLSFNPLSPASVTVGDPALNITATGTPSGGTFSNGASIGGGTGGSFSAVHPSLGTFNYSGSTGVGTASITITYTPLAGAPAVSTYNVNVSSAPPPATLSFNPLSPASVTVGDPALNITATGTPSGGTFSNGASMGGGTGGSFSAVHPSLGTFNYTGSTGAGTASITITYTPLAGAPAMATYEVDVSAVPPPATLSFSPLSPASVTVGAPALNITATGTPSGGTFSNGASVGGGTGGSFSAIHPSLGSFSYTGSTSAGTASITITYTPLAGAPAVATYEVDVSTVPPPATLSFNPLSPASVTVGDPALNITATGTPSGGTFSNGASVGGGTGGNFSAIHPSLGTFNYSGSTGVGTASITITYTPLAGAPAVATYEVDVSAVPPPASLSFNPLSPASVTVGDPALNITATGTPSGGTFSNGASMSGGTGGSFSAVHPSLGTFSYTGSTSAGTASITITYTPLAGAPAVSTYNVNVSSAPPPATLSFNPLSPASVTVGDPALNITATGTPSGGTFSNGASVGGGTGGSFSAIHPSLGTFNYSGSTGVGTASITITYTPLVGTPAVSTYNVNVSSAPPPATLSFNPLSPGSVTVGDPALNITATGTPSGGTFSNGASMGGGTGGSFSAVHPSLGTFNYTGSTSAGTASITITYTPLAGAPAVATYEVDVSAVPPPATLSFSPLSPASVTVGAPALNITATGTPSGGTFSNGASVGGGTGGSFSAVHPSLGSFSYTGSTSAGTASITITYTPLAGAPAVATYEVDVSTVPPPATLSFNPLSPASVTVGDPALNITATGTPSGGTFSNGASMGGGTGGSFSAIHPSLGTFNYSGSTGVGTASITITYTPLAGAPAVATYEVDVSAVPPPASLSFNPLSPASVTVGDPALNITATGTPSGGTFSNGASMSGGTGGSFSAIHPSLGTFNYTGSTSAGTASITITYTPLAGAPAVATYNVNVSSAPPPATLSFNPLSPASVTVGDPALNITATGTPSGGTFSSGASMGGGTGGSFSAIHPSLGTFSYSASTSAGTASITITYTPLAGAPAVATYNVNVSSAPPPATLSFNPLSPASVVVGDPALNITATGTPSGGTFSNGASMGGGTGGSFSAVHPSLGTFSYSASTSAGTASITITYTPLAGAPAVATYNVNVSATPPPATLSFNPLSPASVVVGDPALNITATGTPSGGTFSNGASIGGGTGGSFSAVHSSLGTFSYSGSTSAGTASITITYTPLAGAPAVVTYNVNVSSAPPPATLSFNPLSPASVVVGDPALNITATGTPSGGTFSNGASMGGGTGGSFSAVHPSLGTFSYSGSTSAGTASITITYTPLAGAPAVVIYNVNVSSAPPPASLSFSPISPTSVNVGDPALNITATGTPSGGTFSNGASMGGGTGGSFSAIHPSLGTFSYTGSTSAGATSIDITYTPLAGAPAVATYNVTVTTAPPPATLVFNPLSPASVTVGDPALNITATGTPSGGTYSSSNFIGGSTGGTFSGIHPTLGTFTYSGFADAGTASIDITYTPLAGAPVLVTYSVVVSVIPPPTMLSFSPTSPASITAGDPTLNITATGIPSGGTFSNGASMGGSTGGSFSNINPSSGAFTFSGSTAGGSASILITYTPLSGGPLSLTYTVNVASALVPLFVCDTPILAIPDPGTINPSIVVSGGPNSITDLEVYLDLTHPLSADLDITLTSPSATTVLLTSDNGGSAPNLYNGVIFDDSAGASITTITSAGGTFRPEGFLSDFNGEDSTGLWVLNVTDDAGGNAGVLNSFCLAFDGASIIPPGLPSLSFSPASPATITVGAPVLNITANGAPLGGTYSTSNFVGGGTGGTFSAISSTLGTFSYSGSTAVGTASIDVTYTPPASGSITLTYSVDVTNTPPPTSLSFVPTSPASITVGDPALNITATGTPAAGSYSTSAPNGGGTGGTFSAIDTMNGDFTFSGTTAAGTATITVTYTPPVGAPAMATYVINVSAVPPPASLSFNPLSPASVVVGDPSLMITATGSPSGGTYSSGLSMGGGTGGSFTAIHPSTGVFNFSGTTASGTATMDITYTPLAGAPALLTYVVNVSAVPPPASLSFSPLSPASVTVGDPALNITATGSPSGGTYSTSNFVAGGTGGTFSAISPTMGTFTFSGTTSAGTSSIDVTYTPLAGAPAVLTYVVNVSAVPPPASLVFSPTSPASVTVGDPALNITATGSPSGGTYSNGVGNTGATGGSFSAIHPSLGTFSYTGSTGAGTATIDITYTPLAGAPALLTYTVNVSAVPPPASLSFSPLSPASVTVGDPALNITATGSPSGGTYSTSNFVAGGTGGTFSAISPTMGTFTFSGTTSAGTSSIDVTYTPLAGAPAVLTYVVNVSAVPPPASLSFIPTSPASVVVGDPALNITATGSPSGGTYSSANFIEGGTGGSFSAIHPSAGTFSFSGTTGVGTASLDITYTPLAGAPAVLTYTVNVSAVPPPASLSFIPTSPANILVGDPTLNITATGTPSGGSYSSSNFVGGGTGGTFSGISPAMGTFTFSGTTATGTSSIDVTYTPLAGAPVTVTYSVLVSAVPPPTMLSFVPFSPASVTVGDPALNITATGTPSGGTYSSSNFIGGGTGGTFSAINPSSGIFSYSGSTAAGTASIDITYTPLAGAPVLLTYSVTVSVVPPPTMLSFSPTSPASITAGDPTLNITATGTPSGGTFSNGASMGGSTGGSFSNINPSSGAFTFSGSTAGGSASILITYTPLSGGPLSLTYTVNVASALVPLFVCDTPILAIPNPGTINPSIVVSGGPNSIADLEVYLDLTHPLSADLDITLTSPSATTVLLTSDNGGSAPNLYNGVIFDDSAGASITTITSAGGTFRPEGFLSDFNGEDSTGLWVLNVTDDAGGNAGVLNSFCLAFDGASIIPPGLPSLSFSPASPATITVGAPVLNITANGAPLSGIYSTSNFVGGGTGGTFSAISSTLGTFSYSGSTAVGTASIDVTYTPPASGSITLTYSVDVTNTPPPTSLSFVPTSPASITVGDPALNITATGTPAAGSYSTSAPNGGGTGGTFSAIDTMNGDFTFSGTTAAGTATITVTYTPPVGAPAMATYVINVSAVPPPASLSFNPLSPASVVVGDPSLMITATGSPSGGTYSSGLSMGGGTGGSFTAIHPSTGVFNFSGTTASGTATMDITYTPLAGAPALLTYVVNVSAVPPPASLSFSPLSPASVTVGDPALNITATGSPSGGTYSTSNFVAGGTGGTFSAISPTMGTFTFSGTTSAGTSSIDVTYTPLAGAPAVLTYVVNVSAVPPPASLVFSPTSPASVTVGDPALNITATGSPSGGTYSNGVGNTGATGGSFSAIHPSLGTFSYTGSTGAGTATIDITYTPLAGAPALLTYTVNVSAVPPPASLSFSPLSPASVTVGDPALNITATGSPSGGTYSTSNFVAGGTGGTFSAISPTMGTFTFSGTTSAGTSSIDVTYTPLAGAPAVLTYTVNVSAVPPPASLSFSPLSPASVTVGDPALNITATGSPSGGTYSTSNFVAGGTGGTFSAISPTMGTFTFSGTTSAGTSSIDVTYTPLAGAPAVLTYVVNVSAVPPPASLVFSPTSPASVTVGDPALNITATGSPSGGTYSTSNFVGGGTGGTFSAISPTMGTFTFSGTTTAGTSSIDVTYTPLVGAPAVLTYAVNVSAVPPPTTLIFSPTSPASVTVGDPALNITATGSPSGGTYSTSNFVGGGTGGTFSAISPTMGTFTFSGTATAGTSSIDVTYTPLVGAPLTLTYVVNVSAAPPPTTLVFSPLSPAAVVVGDPALNITATGSPSGGTYSNGASMGGGTGGTFSGISPTMGTFSFSGTTSAGTASVNITYTPLVGMPLSLLYTVNVSAAPPPTTLIFNPISPATITVGDPTLNITATGSPSGGTYSTSNFVEGGTGGTFSAISPTMGTFTFSGTTVVGTSSIDVTYTPISGSPLTLTYVVNVAAVPPPTTLVFSPTSPSAITAGDPTLNITATGTPSGGTYSNGASMNGTTGGSFSAIHGTLGTFSYSGSTAAGTATIQITYTPLVGMAEMQIYTVNVSAAPPPTMLTFNPLSPASITAGDPSLPITATGSPAGGTYSTSGATGGSTGGTFSAISPSAGTFTFSGTTGAGVATVNVTYTPITGMPLTLLYTVNVSAAPPPTTLTFAPISPASISAGASTLNVDANGTPSGGSFTVMNANPGATGGTFSGIHVSFGTFTFSGTTAAGTATIDVTYTPLSGSPLTLTYMVNVGPPPPGMLSFSPISPVSITACTAPISISAIGTPSGGTYSTSNENAGGTGGSFDPINPSSGLFGYSGATTAGTGDDRCNVYSDSWSASDLNLYGSGESSSDGDVDV
jgi:subtilisin-like proprotein convertase family protein/replication initiation and membrane attachment protein DnaB